MALPRLSHWEGTRDALHQIALVVGGIRVACVDPQPNDLHFSLDLTESGFSTATMRCGGVLEFDLESLQLRFARCGATVFTLSAPGHTQVSLAQALVAIFQDSGYSISPSMKRITGTSALEIDAALFAGLPVGAEPRIYGACAISRAAGRLHDAACALARTTLIWVSSGFPPVDLTNMPTRRSPSASRLSATGLIVRISTPMPGLKRAAISRRPRPRRRGRSRKAIPGYTPRMTTCGISSDFDLAVESMLLQYQRRAAAQLQ